MALLAPEVVMVDELSRRWLRGKEAVAAQITSVLSATTSVQSRLSDLHGQPLGADALLLTGWLDQTYNLDGEVQTITAPLSACLQSRHHTWQLLSLQAIPLNDPRNP